jgi:hypothetical protein
MGDRTHTSIRFSGRIPRSLAEELLQELEGQACLSNATDSGTLKLEDLTDSFYDSECNYGQMEGVEDFCREHDIAYEKTWEAGGGYGPGVMIYTGSEELECGTIEGEPALTLAAIKKHGTGFMAFFDSLDFDKYPPVEIVDDPAEQEAA